MCMLVTSLSLRLQIIIVQRIEEQNKFETYFQYFKSKLIILNHRVNHRAGHVIAVTWSCYSESEIYQQYRFTRIRTNMTTPSVEAPLVTFLRSDDPSSWPLFGVCFVTPFMKCFVGKLESFKYTNYSGFRNNQTIIFWFDSYHLLPQRNTSVGIFFNHKVINWQHWPPTKTNNS